MSESERHALAQDAHHYSGYIRERAVRQLATESGGAELSLLLERTNDWVPQVRTLAQAALVARLTPEYAHALACHLDQIEALTRLRRTDQEPFVRAVQRLLLSPEGEAALLRACDDAPPLARRHCRHLAATQLEGERGHAWLHRALSDEAFWLRALAARHAARSATAEQLVLWTREQSTRPPSEIAQRLLYALVERFPEAAQPVLAELVFSPNGGVRRTAQFYFPPKEALLAQYRAALPQHEAVLGLGELGAREALPLVEPLLTHPAPGVRKAALQTLGRLAPEAHKATLLTALTDPTPGMRRVARAALRGHITPDDEPLLRQFEERTLLWELPHWQALCCFVEQDATKEVERWLCQKASVLPTVSQCERLHTALDTTALPSSLITRLQQELAHAERQRRHRSAC